MPILDNVVHAKATEGLRIVIAGQEKIGKTTLVSQAPKPLLVPLEIGYSGVDIHRTQMLEDYGDVMGLIGEITTQAQAGNFPYRTLIFDSATALERMIHTSVCKMDSSYTEGNKKAVTMETALGGYGKAYTFANEKFDMFLKALDLLAVRGGIHVVLTCHVFAAKLIDPNVGEYDSWDLQLHSPKNQKTYGKREMVTQWADLIGFLYEPIFVSKGENITKGMSSNKGRVIGLSRTPSYVAGNRFGVEGEVVIPKVDGWNHFAHAIFQASGINIYNVQETQQ